MHITSFAIAGLRFTVLGIVLSGLAMIATMLVVPFLGFVPGIFSLSLAAVVGILGAGVIVYRRCYGHILIQWQSTAVVKMLREVRALDKEFQGYNAMVHRVRDQDHSWVETLRLMRLARATFLPLKLSEIEQHVKKSQKLSTDFYYQLTARSRCRVYLEWRANYIQLRTIYQLLQLVRANMRALSRMAEEQHKTGLTSEANFLDVECQELRELLPGQQVRGRFHAPQ